MAFSNLANIPTLEFTAGALSSVLGIPYVT